MSDPPDSYSATFLRWAQPLLALVADGPRSARKSGLEIASGLWNAVVLEDAGLAPGAVAELRQRLGDLHAPGQEAFTAALEELVTRKRADFAEDRWAIARCELRSGGRIFVEARAIPTR